MNKKQKIIVSVVGITIVLLTLWDKKYYQTNIGLNAYFYYIIFDFLSDNKSDILTIALYILLV